MTKEQGTPSDQLAWEYWRDRARTAEAALAAARVPAEAISLLQEGATSFGRLLISTSDDKAVRDWQKRCRAFLAKTITGAG